MAAVDSTRVLIAAYSKCCIQELNLESNSLQTYIGSSCGGSASYNGHRLTAVNIWSPFGIAVESSAKIFVSIFSAQEVVAMSISGDEITSTIYSTSSYRPRYLSLGDDPTSIYLTLAHAFGVYHMDEQRLEIIAGSTGSGSDAADVSSLQFNKPCAFAKVDSSTWFITEFSNSR